MTSPPSSEVPGPQDSEAPARVLVVGGSDPSGSAGVQTDIKTLTSLGVDACTAIVSITVQGRDSFSDAMSIPATLVGAQMDAAVADGACAVIKTGMLDNEDVVQVVADRADRVGTATALVIDPVLESSSGRSLLSERGQRKMVERLFPRAALVTPNLPEARRLTGIDARSVDDMSRIADHFLAFGVSAVLVKGGHLLDHNPELEEVTDLLRTIDGEEVRFARARVSGSGFRGTGCCLASAIAAGIAEGLTLKSAVERARDYLHAAMQRGQGSALDRARKLPRALRHGPLDNQPTVFSASD